MTSKHLGPRRRWLAWAAATAGLVAITAVAASSMAGAAPFIPAVPGAEHSRQLDASAVLDQLEFPVEYASEGSSGNNCGATPVLEANCKRVAELFTLTKRVDHTTPILAQSSASGKPYQKAVITVRDQSTGTPETLITYTLEDVRVVDDHQVFNTHVGGGSLREVITLAYAKITWHVGTTKAGRDWAANRNI